MIAIIDYGMGNIRSIANMLKKIGAKVFLANRPKEVEMADKIILPGVGSFDTGMTKLKVNGLEEAVKKHALVDEKPILGICLGMQMLGKKSEEGIENGLSLIPFETKKFNFNGRKDLKIPHMGWDNVKIKQKNDPLLTDIALIQRYYFVHSYHAVCKNKENILMLCEYGYLFAAAVKYKKIYGFQFHPEKSHQFGMSLLENFVRRI